jgi:transcriptional regulator with XRE-family HTH domain
MIQVSEFTEYLFKLRERSGLSQYELAKRAGINPTHLNRIEKGERNPPKRNTIFNISEVLGLNRKERTELFIKAGYAPPAIKKEKKSGEIPTPLVYESPLSENEIAELGKCPDLSNPTVLLVAEALSDPGIPQKERTEMEKEISSFVAWLWDKMRKQNKG